MNIRPMLARPPVLSQLLAALLACALSTGLLGAVSGLFERDGAPFARAELGCTPRVGAGAEPGARTD